MAEQVRIEGLREINKKLRRLPVAVANKHLNRATSQGATLVVKSAKQKVPVLTGTILKNIKKRKHKTSTKMIASTRVGVISDKTGRGSGTDAYYWTFVEFGTHKMAARPFLRPAFEDSKLAAANKIKKVLAIAVETEAKR